MNTRFLRFIICLLPVVFTAAPWPALHALQREDIRGLEAAQAWLEWVDAGKYAESWEAAAPAFREQIDRAEWIGLMETHRKPLGAVTERTLKRLFFTTELPDAPSGYYVVVQFETRFSGREETALETLTPMLVALPGTKGGEAPRVLPEGEWRVVGYYVN